MCNFIMFSLCVIILVGLVDLLCVIQTTRITGFIMCNLEY